MKTDTQADPPADTLLGGRVKIFHPAHYRSSIDSVLLAGFTAKVLLADKRQGKNLAIAELGVGPGAVMLCLLYHLRQAGASPISYTGFDNNRSFLDLARRSLAANDVEAVLHCLDIREIQEDSGYDAVVMNPPFYSHDPEAGKPRHPERTAALYQGEVPFSQWIQTAARMLTPKGQLFVIYQASKIHEMLAGLNPHFGDLRILPLHSFAGDAAKRVLIACGYQSRAESRILPGLIIHQPDGGYSDEADAILNAGLPNLPLA